ncbi:MAG: hypothetical protein WD317_08840 [Balneolaceae bacterium]
MTCLLNHIRTSLTERTVSLSAIRQRKWLLLFLFPLLSSCTDNDDQRAFERQAFQMPDSYTETDGSGEVTGAEDPEDWQTAPFFRGLVEVRPAFPNPVQTTDPVEIELLVTGIESRVNGLIAYVVLDSGYISDPLDTIDENPVQPGIRHLRFPAQYLARFNDPRGLRRIVIFDRNDNIISYGDIEVI